MLQRRFLISLFLASAALAQTPPLMPMPAKITPSDGVLKIDAGFRVALIGYQEPRVHRAAFRLIERLQKQTGITLSHDLALKGLDAALTISCEHAGKTIQELGEDESYKLAVSSTSARLDATEPLGVLRGIETFLQAVQPGASGFEIKAVTIDDAPRFPWRGLTYDVSRHFMPVDQVKRTLDGMAAVKLNVFHWHLSDDQGFRVESKTFPRLQQAGSEGRYYTQAEIRDIIAYARDRGIRVVPEFDMPAHTSAMLVAYPALATDAAPTEVDHELGVRDPAMDPTKPGVYVFLDRFIREMAELFPDAYFHIGGDEVNGKVWSASKRIQDYKTANHLEPTADDKDANKALQAAFNKRLHALLVKHGKRMEGWDEILQPGFPKDILIQSWRGQKSLSDAVRLGYRGILSSGWYLDLAYPAADHYLVDPLDKEAASLTPEEQKSILGGEAAMWSEWVTPETMDSRLWPRAAAIAERLWSPKEVRDVPDMYRRMAIISGELEWLGLTHRSWQGPMLNRLAGEHDARPLAILTEMLEPVKGYDREKFGPYTTQTPLIRLVDATPPESDAARRFAGLVEAAAWDAVKAQLLMWNGNAGVPQSNAWLNDVAVVSRNANEMTGIGLEAVAAIKSGNKMDAGWMGQRLSRIQELNQPEGALLIAAAPSIVKLVHIAAKE